MLYEIKNGHSSNAMNVLTIFRTEIILYKNGSFREERENGLTEKTKTKPKSSFYLMYSSIFNQY